MELLDTEKALQTATCGAPVKSWGESVQGKPRTREMLARIWLAAQAIWGHKWTSANGDLPIDGDARLAVAGALWLEGLRGLTERQVLRAIDRMAKGGSEWPPNLPELRKVALGVPDFRAVNFEILCSKNGERTPFTCLVWSFIDGYAHHHANSKDAELMRRGAYERACEHVLQGGALPEPTAGEFEHDRTPRSTGIRATRKDRVERLQKILAADFNPLAVATSDRC